MKRRYIIFILFVVILSVFAVWSIPLGTSDQVLPVTLNVTNNSGRVVGFTVTKEELEELDFGMTFPGTIVVKTINITRGNQPPAFISIFPEGTIASWISVSEGNFLLKNPKQVMVSVKVPEDANEGVYTGNIRIIYKKTVFSLLLT
jgi:hypothetical protein